MENTMKSMTVVTVPSTVGYPCSHAVTPSLRARTSGFGGPVSDGTDATDAIETRGTRAWSPPT